MTKVTATLRTLDHWPRKQLYQQIADLHDTTIDLAAQVATLREALEGIISDPIGQAAMDYAAAREVLLATKQ